MNSTETVLEKNLSRPRLWLMRLLSVCFGLLIVFVLLEVVFRILPTSDATKRTDVNDANPYLRFEPDRVVNFTIGRFFDIQTVKRVNKQGFFDDADFYSDSTKKKIAIIGDSYVEALQVSNKDAIHGQLRSLLSEDYVVNGIGMSGSPLSQYLAYSKLVKQDINPDYFVFVIVGNDFDESMTRYLTNAGYHHYNDDLQIVRFDLKTPLHKKIIRSSAIARYFAINMSGYVIPNPFSKEVPVVEYQDNTLKHVDEERLEWSKKASDAFIKDVKKVTLDKPVILVLDGHRDQIYKNRTPDENAYSSDMMSYIKRQAEKAEMHVIDMHPLFDADYRINGKKFEFDTDWHWNERGHMLAAQAVKDKILSISVR